MIFIIFALSGVMITIAIGLFIQNVVWVDRAIRQQRETERGDRFLEDAVVVLVEKLLTEHAEELE